MWKCYARTGFLHAETIPRPLTSQASQGCRRPQHSRAGPRSRERGLPADSRRMSMTGVRGWDVLADDMRRLSAATDGEP